MVGTVPQNVFTTGSLREETKMSCSTFGAIPPNSSTMNRLLVGGKESSPGHGEEMIQEAVPNTRRGLTAQGQLAAKAALVTFSLLSDCSYGGTNII